MSEGKSTHSLIVIWCALLLISVMISCSNLSPTDEPISICTGDQVPSLNRERFGYFAPELYTDFTGHLDSLTRTFGATPAYLLWYIQIDDLFPTDKVRFLADRGISMVISMNIKSLKIDPVRNDTLMAEIAAGVWDSTLTDFAVAAGQMGSTVYLRFGYEMNGDWFPWGGEPAAFKKAWSHAWGVFQRAGASNIRWIFSPSALWEGKTAERDLYPYYPGDSLVDAIGIDGYNYGDGFDRWHSWESFSRVFGRSLQAIQYMGKPIWITEAGCPSDARRPDWLAGMFQFMADNPCVEALLWFNACKSGEPDFRFESDDTSLVMLREWLRQ